MTEESYIGAGGLCRNTDADWCLGFSANKGYGQVIEAELWAVCIGLSYAVEYGFFPLQVETDSELTRNLIVKGTEDCHPLASMVGFCKKIMTEKEVSITHVYRECNRVADLLAKMGLSHGLGTIKYNAPPSSTVTMMKEDAALVGRPRSLP